MTKVSAIQKELDTSKELFEFTGKKRITRSEALKAIWAYINENDLKVVGGVEPDDNLSKILGPKKVTASEIMKCLSFHLSK